MKDKGRLFIVATPIGNLEDITYRAIKVLSQVKWIAAEDTRIIRKLLSHYNIHTNIFSLHSYNEKQRVKFIIDKLSKGEDIALVSDAGIPVLSDPGELIIREVIKEGFKVIPIPGPSAVTTCLMVAGLPWKGSIILGFLSRKKKKRKEELKELKELGNPIILFESPLRLLTLLEELEEIFPERDILVCRELTKIHEEILRGKAKQLLKEFRDRGEIKGEITLFIGPGEKKKKEKYDKEILNLIKAVIDIINDDKLTPREKAKKLSLLLKIPTNEAYKFIIELRL